MSVGYSLNVLSFRVLSLLDITTVGLKQIDSIHLVYLPSEFLNEQPAQWHDEDSSERPADSGDGGETRILTLSGPPRILCLKNLLYKMITKLINLHSMGFLVGKRGP